MKADFNTLLDECLGRLTTGEEPERVLADYPEEASDLRPLLVLAAQVRALPIPQASSEAKEDALQRMLDAFEANKVLYPNPSRWTPAKTWFSIKSFLLQISSNGSNRTFRYALAGVFVLALTFSSLLLSASASSLPGDPLYPVKRGVEEVMLAVTVDEEARESLQEDFLAERQEEIQQMVQQQREGALEITAVVEEQVSQTEWVIGGMHVFLTDQTIFESVPSIGEEVAVRVWVQQNGVKIALTVGSPGGPQSPGKVPDMATRSHTPPGQDKEENVPGHIADQTGTHEPPKATNANHPTKTPHTERTPPRRTSLPSPTPSPTATLSPYDMPTEDSKDKEPKPTKPPSRPFETPPGHTDESTPEDEVDSSPDLPDTKTPKPPPDKTTGPPTEKTTGPPEKKTVEPKD